jgi:F420-dependent oxidoreductase-like protein
MQLRIFTEPQQGARYQTLLAVARTAEECGFDGFFRSDHFLADEKFPTGGPGGLPGPSDAWITLAGLAVQTSRLRLGTLMTAATFRHPGSLAIAVAGVDQMSSGRVELGLGTGWFEAEHRAYGIPFPPLPERFERLEEQLALITGLWQTPAGQRYSFAGRHYALADSPALPKPAQVPRPPIIVGGTGPRRTPRLAARFADEFNVPYADLSSAANQFARARAACAAAGREAARPLLLSATLPVCCGRSDREVSRRARAIGRDLAELRQAGLAGSPAEVLDAAGRWAEIGASRLYLAVLDLTDLDQLALVADQVLPQTATL